MTSPDHRNFYTGEAAGYEGKRYGSPYGRLFRWWQRDAVARALAEHSQRRCTLDVATGTGQMLPSLADASEMVVASDLTAAMLAVARCDFSRLSAIQYCVADATQLPYAEGSFDAVASSRFLHLFEVRQQQSLIAQMASVLEPGGILIVDFYSADGRRIFAPAIWLYRLVLHVRSIEGLGNFMLVPWLWLPQPWVRRIARWLGRNCISMSEQFIVVAHKP